MNMIDPVPAYVSQAAYWRLVEATLTEVFGLQTKDARQRLDRFMARLAGAPAAERLLGLHAEPFQVATDLAGDAILAPDAPNYAQRYKTLAAAHGWAPEAGATAAPSW
ncbi:MAG: hypothetical protein WDN04_04220 [Rhodospirillales bacterium]